MLYYFKSHQFYFFCVFFSEFIKYFLKVYFLFCWLGKLSLKKKIQEVKKYDFWFTQSPFPLLPKKLLLFETRPLSGENFFPPWKEWKKEIKKNLTNVTIGGGGGFPPTKCYILFPFADILLYTYILAALMYVCDQMLLSENLPPYLPNTNAAY